MGAGALRVDGCAEASCVRVRVHVCVCVFVRCLFETDPPAEAHTGRLRCDTWSVTKAEEHPDQSRCTNEKESQVFWWVLMLQRLPADRQRAACQLHWPGITHIDENGTRKWRLLKSAVRSSAPTAAERQRTNHRKSCPQA